MEERTSIIILNWTKLLLKGLKQFKRFMAATLYIIKVFLNYLRDLLMYQKQPKINMQKVVEIL